MRFFKRVSDIISSNVNSVLDKMEDPEKMIDLSINELEEAITEMNATLGEITVELNSLKALVKDEREALARWSERAKLAVNKGEDGLAREAITEKQRIEQKLIRDEEAISSIENKMKALAESKDEATSKLTEMKAKSLELKTRAKVAKEKLNVNEKIHKSEEAAWARRIEEMKSKIAKWEAMADLTTAPVNKETQVSFEELEKAEAVEKELEELKANC